AGLFITTDASLPAASRPAYARPIACTVFSLIWKPDADATGLTSAPATATLRAASARPASLGAVIGCLLMWISSRMVFCIGKRLARITPRKTACPGSFIRLYEFRYGGLSHRGGVRASSDMRLPSSAQPKRSARTAAHRFSIESTARPNFSYMRVPYTGPSAASDALMPQTKPRRRPPLSRSLPCFLPSLIAVFLAIWIPPAWERYSLLLLLIGASLSMAAVCHAIGFGCEHSFVRTALRRGSAHLIALAIHTAIVFLLVAWPLMALSQAPSLAAALGLAVALAVALLVLWRFWPVFGLVFAWDDAFPAGEEHSWITAALARSLAFARHLTRGRDLFLTHFLPASLAQLAIAFGALSLAGMGASLPDEIRTASLFLFAVVVLPLCSLIVADRTLRLLFGGRSQHVPPPSAEPPSRAPDAELDAIGAVETDDGNDRDESAPHAAESAPAEPPLPQATLDEGLLAAVRAGDLASANDWLARGASPDAAPPAGARDQRSALVLAAELPDTRLLRSLIGKGAQVNRPHAGLTPLLAATRSCSQGRPETVTTLVAN